VNIEFSPNEARVIGSLIEKEITTPDQYPLSLNALTNACNQKTNREPVLELTESAVQQTVDALMKNGARESRYAHLFSGSIESVEEPVAQEAQPGAAALTTTLATLLAERVSRLEERVQQLQAEIDALKGGAEPARRSTAE
jgi:uncharacterized protein YceH (UPF0502 family)